MKKQLIDLTKGLILAIAGGAIALWGWSIQHDTEQEEYAYQRKFATMERLSGSLTEYMYLSGGRALIQFESMNLVSGYIPATVDSVVRIELPIATRIDLQDSLKALYPIAYELMMRGDEKAHATRQDLLMARLLFGPEVGRYCDEMEKYFPIDTIMKQHVDARPRNTRLTSHDMNDILMKIHSSQGRDVSALLTAMAQELELLDGHAD